MKTKSASQHLLHCSAWSGVVLVSLAGCSPPSAPAKDPAVEVQPGLVDPSRAIGAVVFGTNGEVLVVDAEGKPVQPCALPVSGKEPGAAGDMPECHKVRDTTITMLQSIALVGHTGSSCLTLAPSQTVSGGGFVQGATAFQIPPGCAQ